MNNLIDRFHAVQGQKELLKKQYDKEKIELEKIKKRSAVLEKLQVIIQQTAKDMQEQVRVHIEDIVQLAIDSCFPEKYVFQVLYEIKRGRTEAQISLLENGNRVYPLDAAGGGVVDIISFALRIAVWTLSNSTNTIILDEPFRFLSRDLQPEAGKILKELSKKLNLQFIIVTHNPALEEQADKLFTVTQKDGISLLQETSLIVNKT